MSLIISFAAARTGSSRAGQVLRSAGFQYISEAFAKGRCKLASNNWHHKEDLAKELNCKPKNLRLSNILASKSSLTKTASFLQSIHEDVIVEVFPSHLAIKQLGILACHSKGIIVIQRILIDQFISMQKVRETARQDGKMKWGNLDTTSIKVNLDCNVFKNFLIYQLSYYSFVNAIVSTFKIGDNIAFINYNDWSSRIPSEQESFLSSKVETFIRKCNNLCAETMHPSTRLFKQDKNIHWKQSVANSEEFEQGITQLGIRRLAFLKPLDIINNEDPTLIANAHKS